MEIVHNETGIAMTWSPDPQKFTGIKPEFQFHETLCFIKLLKECCSAFQAYPELNLNGNIHWHCRLVIKDNVKWFKSVLPKFKYNGFVLLKKIFDKNNWDKYIQKDKPIMEMILKIELPIYYLKGSCIVQHELIQKVKKSKKEKNLDFFPENGIIKEDNIKI